MNELEDKRCVASWALLRKLYNHETDLYVIISDFIRYSIFKNALREFDVATITKCVNKEFGIRLIDAVVKRALKKLHLQVAHGMYVCNPNDYSDLAELSATIHETTSNSNDILNMLFEYVEKEQGRGLSTEEREELMASFNLFMLDKKVKQKYNDLIACFIVGCKKNLVLATQLTEIKEGVVLYGGLNYNAKTDNASKKWSDEITVYMDTEVLFHMAGYNGETYKQIFDDFFNLVNEINADSINKTQKKRIHLRYFKHTEVEYDKFFQRAEDIVRGNATLIYSVTAMNSITKGCKSPSDVAEKKVAFETLLKTHGITCDDESNHYYELSDYRYNIECDTFIDRFTMELTKAKRKEVEDSLISLSHIFVLRKGKISTCFEKTGFILLTDNFITRYIAWDEEVKGISGNVLCTDLYYFTDRLWCRLGKSFGLNASPKAYDVISRAQIILSSRINASVTAEYDELLAKYKNKEVSKDDVLEVLSELRSKVMKPEDIQTESNIDAALQAISGHNLEAYIQEKERKAAELADVKDERDNLSTKLTETKAIHQKEMAAQEVIHAQKLIEANELLEKEKQYSIKAISMERALKEMILLRQEDKRKKLDFIKKQRCEALKNGICQIVSFVCFVTLSILSQWLVVTYKKVEIAWYLQTLITIFAAIVSQAIPIWRSLKFGSSDIKNEFALLFRIGRIETKKKLIAEYRKQVKAPSLMKAYNKHLDSLSASNTK